jgi:hypothetical protein
MARRALAYRAWYVAPGEASVPPVIVITDARLQQREQLRQLRRAQFGLFDSIGSDLVHRASA